MVSNRIRIVCEPYTNRIRIVYGSYAIGCESYTIRIRLVYDSYAIGYESYTIRIRLVYDSYTNRIQSYTKCMRAVCDSYANRVQDHQCEIINVLKEAGMLNCTMFDLRIFYINLDDAAERRQRMENMLHAMSEGVHWQRWRAVYESYAKHIQSHTNRMRAVYESYTNRIQSYTNRIRARARARARSRVSGSGSVWRVGPLIRKTSPRR